jgi:hypothetical protein
VFLTDIATSDKKVVDICAFSCAASSVIKVSGNSVQVNSSSGISSDNYERIFITKARSTRDIEEKQQEDVIQAVDDGLKPHI